MVTGCVHFFCIFIEELTSHDWTDGTIRTTISAFFLMNPWRIIPSVLIILGSVRWLYWLYWLYWWTVELFGYSVGVDATWLTWIWTVNLCDPHAGPQTQVHTCPLGWGWEDTCGSDTSSRLIFSKFDYNLEGNDSLVSLPPVANRGHTKSYPWC